MEKDIFDEMTKKEIIAWLKEYVFFKPPRRSWLLLRRWKVGVEKLQFDEDEEMAEFKKVDFSERDELARAFNASTSGDEKLEILKRMEPYQLAIRKHLDAYKRFRAREKRIDKLYEQIDIEREKEMNARL